MKGWGRWRDGGKERAKEGRRGLANFVGEALLAEGFEEDEGGAVGEVEGAGLGIEHGDAKPVGGVFCEEGFREAGGFAAEDEVVAGLVGDFGVVSGTVGLDEPEAGGGGKGLAEGGPVGPAVPGDLLPVVHAGAFELAVVELEAEGFDEMEGGVGGGAEAGDVAGVGRDFGFEEDDVHEKQSSKFKAQSSKS